MSAQVLGPSPIRIQWFRDGVPLAGQNATTLRIPVALTNDAGLYQVGASNAYTATLGLAQMAFSQGAQLAVLPVDGAFFRYDAAGNLTNIEPALALTPSFPSGEIPRVQEALGQPLALTAQIINPGIATYQWLHDGTAIPGATNDVLYLASSGAIDAGGYSLIVGNAYGTVTGLVAQVSFHPEYDQFSSSSGIILRGDAVLTNSQLRLTRASPNQLGSAWFEPKQFCRNGLTTRFQFRITPQSGLIPADGISFNIQNSGTDAAIGEGGTGASIEFNTYRNAGEASSNSVVVFAPGQPPLEIDLTPFGLTLNDGQRHTVEMEHDGLTLNVWLDNQRVVQDAFMVFEPFLDTSGYAWVGFGARCGGGGGESHEILNWSFIPNAEYSPAGLPGPWLNGATLDVTVSPQSDAVPEGGKAALRARYLHGLGRFTTPQCCDSQTVSDFDIAYQWFFQGVALEGQTNATLVLSNLQSNAAGEYSVTLFGWAAGGLSGGISRAPFASATNSVVMSRIQTLFGTGLANDRSPLPNGSVDPHWSLVQGATRPTRVRLPQSWLQLCLG